MRCKHMDEHVLVSALQEYETSKAEEEKERMSEVAGSMRIKESYGVRQEGRGARR